MIVVLGRYLLSGRCIVELRRATHDKAIVVDILRADPVGGGWLELRAIG